MPKPRYKTAKGMLNEIDKFLTHADGKQSAKLWAILTALRGPDIKSTEQDSQKTYITAVIRAKAFPLFARDRGLYGYVYGVHVNTHTPRIPRDLLIETESNWHFIRHSAVAYKDLKEIGLMDKEKDNA